MNRYIVQKRVLANSVKEAIKNEAQSPIDGIWSDDKYHESKDIGFNKRKKNKTQLDTSS